MHYASGQHQCVVSDIQGGHTDPNACVTYAAEGHSLGRPKSNKCASFNANPPCCGSALFILLMILKVQRHCSSSTCGRLFVCPGANVTYNAFPHHADRGSIPSTHYAETGPNCE